MSAANPTVVVLDYGSGNVHSAAKALEAAQTAVALEEKVEKIQKRGKPRK